MKIAMAIENFSRQAGGAESYAVELAGKLVSEGWEVHLYGHSWDGYPHGAVFHGIPALPKWIPPSIRIFNFALRHRNLVRQQHFDVVLGFGNTVEMNVYQSHGGVHVISHMRKLKAVSSPLLRLLKTILLFATPKYHARAWIESAPFRLRTQPEIIAISDMVRDDIAQYFRVPKGRIRLIYNGIDVKRFGASLDDRGARLRKDMGFDDQILFLFMGYDFKKKGVRPLIEAAAVLRDQVDPSSFGLVVVGGRPSPSLQRLVKTLQLTEMVRFSGSTSEPEVFYQACDVFILPTFYDACSLVVFEAMAAGLPAITTVYNGAAGIIEDGIDGKVLQDPTNIAEMAEAMRVFLDLELLRTASEAARRKASQYKLESNHRQMLEIFHEVLRGNSNRT